MLLFLPKFFNLHGLFYKYILILAIKMGRRAVVLIEHGIIRAMGMIGIMSIYQVSRI